jgi:RibD C-terminal domain
MGALGHAEPGPTAILLERQSGDDPLRHAELGDRRGLEHEHLGLRHLHDLEAHRIILPAVWVDHREVDPPSDPAIDLNGVGWDLETLGRPPDRQLCRVGERREDELARSVDDAVDLDPLGAPVWVVTHDPPRGFEDAPFTFVTNGVDKAVEQASAAAGDGLVGVNGPDIAQQCLNAGLLDAVRLSVVPALLGEGIPYFAGLENTPIRLKTPRVVEGDGVTHLYYEVS